MSEQPIEIDWQTIDELLFDNNVLVALKTMRIETGCGVNQLLDLVHARFDKLAAEYPERFRCDIKTYWDGYGGSD